MKARCQFIYADGRRCSLPRLRKHRTLCRTHAERDHRRRSPSRIAKDLASLSGEFKTASDVNHALGKVWTLLAQSRIPRRDAVTFAYIAQLLLQSLPSVRREIREVGGADGWQSTIESVLAANLESLEPDDGSGYDEALDSDHSSEQDQNFNNGESSDHVETEG